MAERLCPIVSAIREIRGGGGDGSASAGGDAGGDGDGSTPIYFDGAEETSERVIKVGGADSAEIVCDHVMFYMMSRKMALARFEMAHPEPRECAKVAAEMFRGIAGEDYETAYPRIVDAAISRSHLYNQFVGLIDLIGQLDEFILARVSAAAKAGKPINVSLPNIVFLPHIDQLIIYRPDVLERAMNRIIDYMRALNINSILTEPVHCELEHIPRFAVLAPDMTTLIPAITGRTTDEFLEKMHAVLKHEMRVASYVAEIEKYHCDVINHMNAVYDIIKKMITRAVAGLNSGIAP
jgi:hypothetical protein